MYKVCIKYIFSRRQKTKKPKRTPANIFASIYDHINRVNIPIL